MTSPAPLLDTPGLADALRPGAVVPLFQPIVDLVTGEVRAYEALARWPHSPGLTPTVAFDLAAAADRTLELDWACRVAAVEAARGQQLPVFVNVESGVADDSAPDLFAARWEQAAPRVSLVLELTERALLQRPDNVLRVVAQARERGVGIALDDVGADPASLAMLDLVAPDVIKLDLRLVQHAPALEQARILAVVMAHQERSGATVLAEGIETASHLDQALAFGAELGQGWMFGRPAPLPATAARTSHPLRLRPLPPSSLGTTFEVARRHLPVRVAPKHLLLSLTRHIEDLALDTRATPMVLAALQSADHFGGETSSRYARLARTAPLVAVFGTGLDAEPAPGVRGVTLAPADPLSAEWTVVALGPRTATAVIATDCGDGGPDDHRRFQFAITHDRELTCRVARVLVRRMGGPRSQLHGVV